MKQSLMYAFSIIILPLLFMLGLWQALASVPFAQAESSVNNYVVTSTANDGPGSLRKIISDTNMAAQPALVTFNLSGCPCVIHLLSALPLVTPVITIQGPGAGMLAIDGGGSVPIFRFNSFTSVQDLTIQNGADHTFFSAAGIDAGSTALTLTNVILRDNTGTAGSNGAVVASSLTAKDTQFIHNQGDSGAVYVFKLAALTNVIFLRNTSTSGAAAVRLLGTGSGYLQIVNATFISNTASSGGSIVSGFQTMTVTNASFFDNVGESNLRFSASFHPTASLRLVNSLFTTKAAMGTTDSMVEINGTAQVLHTTIAQPGAAAGRAIAVINTLVTHTVGITDSIIASYTLGIYQASVAAVREDYNLFFATGTPTQGTVTSGGHSVSGNPKFVNPAGGDYHLSAGSAAINVGVNAGVNTDIDGQPRPLGGGFDIGFDEYINLPNKLYLPTIVR